MAKIYAVKEGRQTGIFNTWDECKSQVDGYPGADYKSFKNMEDAQAYLGTDTAKQDEKPVQKIVGKCYAVKAGLVPGIYATWDECRQQTEGYSGAQYKSFPTYEAAEEWMRA